MTAKQFILSNRFKYRLARHVTFWVVYCSYFYIQSIPPRNYGEFFIGKTYFIALMNLCAFAPVFIAITYFFIYYLLPNTIQKKQFLLFIAGFFVTYLVGTIINYVTAEWFLTTTRYFPNSFQHRIEMSNYNTRWGMVIATLGLGIKLSKDWYLQQQENIEIIKRKARIETQLEKAKIHPEFLLRSLDTIYTNIQCDSPKTPSLILNLSEVLSYSLYENKDGMVLLKDEIAQLQHLIKIELAKEGRHIYIEMQLSGNMDNKYVAPMIFVKTLEQIISNLYAAHIHSCYVQLNLTAEYEVLLLAFLLRADEHALCNINWDFFIAPIQTIIGSYYAQQDFKVAMVRHTTAVSINLALKVFTYAEATKHSLDK